MSGLLAMGIQLYQRQAKGLGYPVQSILGKMLLHGAMLQVRDGLTPAIVCKVEFSEVLDLRPA